MQKHNRIYNKLLNFLMIMKYKSIHSYEDCELLPGEKYDILDI